MGKTRVGTVGYSYRDWAGIFFPPGSPPRRQFNIYANNFDVCELTQFTHQMPDPERMQHFAAQIKTDLRLFVRIHNTFTHCADVGLALTVARHFRKAMEPLNEEGKLAGFVAAFPYAFKNTPDNREYILQLANQLSFGAETPLQLDFRHMSWLTPEAIEWVSSHELGLVLVDEPALPGLVPPLAVATSGRVLVRLHGRNAAGWWSGNQATRFDYSYSRDELAALKTRYEPLEARRREVSFLFHNNWQAQSVNNAVQFRTLLAREAIEAAPRVFMPSANDFLSSLDDAADPLDDESGRPPTSLPLSEVKSRVSRALASAQSSLDLPLRDDS
ncbi:MAG: DUF72 domain-containing protein [Deltaproteobacteria bacterium]|nr:DUF72 domain-containing protein [Deltaproteobacteria bacterium]